jgi:hypothetical protein
MQVDGSPIAFDTWHGARDGVGRPHGPGVVITDNYEGVLCYLDHGVIAGSSLWRRESGGRQALMFDSNGKMHGYCVIYNGDEVTVIEYKHGVEMSYSRACLKN